MQEAVLKESLLKVAIKSDFEQWYDAEFYPSSMADAYYRRMRFDDRLPWVMHEEEIEKASSLVSVKAGFVSDGVLEEIPPGTMVEVFDAEGRRLGVDIVQEVQKAPEAHWVREWLSSSLGGVHMFRIWRVGTLEAIIHQKTDNLTNPHAGNIETRPIELRGVPEGVQVPEYPMSLMDFRVIEEGVLQPYWVTYVPDVDGLGFEQLIDGSHVYTEMAVWHTMVG